MAPVLVKKQKRSSATDVSSGAPFGLPIGDQLVQGARIEHGAGKNVSPDLRALL